MEPDNRDGIKFEQQKPKNKWGLSNHFLKKSAMDSNSNNRHRSSPRPSFQPRQRLYNSIAYANRWLLAVSSIGIDILGLFIYNVYCSIKKLQNNIYSRKAQNKKENRKMSNSTIGTSPIEAEIVNRKGSKKPQKWTDHWFITGIINIVLLLAVSSIAYSTYIVYMGTGDEVVPKVALIPQAVLALAIAVYKFFKK